MNIAIEYAIRNGLNEENLQMPFSLFVYNIKKIDEVIVITLQNSYGDNQTCIVKHWYLNYLKKTEMLPNKKEFLINKKDLTKSPHVIMEDFILFKYVESPYQSPSKQYSDEPHSTIQKKEFDKCIKKFFNCEKNFKYKKNILWEFFVKTFFTTSTLQTDFGFLPQESQRELIKDVCPIPWKVWNYWLKYLLYQNEKLKHSPELIFEKYYQEKLDKNDFYLKTKNSDRFFSICTDVF